MNKKTLLSILNFLLMILAVLLVDFYWQTDFGNWRYIGIIGFMMIGWMWDHERWTR